MWGNGLTAANESGILSELTFCSLLWVLLQACGVNFLPMEQRMTRDFDAWREEHNWHRRSQEVPRKEVGQEVIVCTREQLAEMSRDAQTNQEEDELSGLFSKPAGRSLLVRSNSVAY